MNDFKKKVIKEVYHSFREFMIVKGVMGLKAPKNMVDPLWGGFEKSLGWRIDNVFKEYEKSRNQRSTD